MKALYIKEPMKCAMRDIPDVVPDGHRPVLKILTCGICGTDVPNWALGFNPLWAFGGIMDNNGPTLGHEFVARIVDPADAAAKGFKAGDRVTMMPFDNCGTCYSCLHGKTHLCWEGWTKWSTGILAEGAMAETLLGYPEWLFKIPDDISDEEAALIEPTAVCVHACRAAEIREGSNVLIIGGGMLGQMSGTIARLCGAKNIVMAEMNMARAQAAVERGAADIAADISEPDCIAKLMQVTEGVGFDSVLDCTASESAAEMAVQVIRTGGRVIIVSAGAKLTVSPIFLQKNEPIVTGILGYEYRDFKRGYELICDKKIDAKSFITRVIPFEADAIQSAFESMTAPGNTEIKTVVRISE